MERTNNLTGFGSNVGSISIKYHNGNRVVHGYIVNQLGTASYLVTTDGKKYQEVYLAQTTEEATTLPKGKATIVITNEDGLSLFVKKMQAFVCTTTDGREVRWTSGTPSGEYFGIGSILPTPESITRSPATTTIEVDGTRHITVSVMPEEADQNVKFTSSNTDTATVSSTGLITGVAAGTATITIKSSVNSKVTATVAVTVTAPTPPAPEPEPEPTPEPEVVAEETTVSRSSK